MWLNENEAPRILNKPDEDEIPKISYRLSEKLFQDEEADLDYQFPSQRYLDNLIQENDQEKFAELDLTKIWYNGIYCNFLLKNG
jgi:hypothetical protein